MASWDPEVVGDLPGDGRADCTELERVLLAVLEEIGRDDPASWREVALGASDEARRVAKLEWVGRAAVFQALAALGGDRKATRRAIGIRRLPSWAILRGRRYSLLEWQLVRAGGRRRNEAFIPYGREWLAQILERKRSGGEAAS